MLKHTAWGVVMIAMMAGGAAPQALAAQTVVLELFTLQGCSSCPPADALMKRLSAEDPALLPLSLHVHYWDYLGWKDPYSSAGNTGRQKGYAAALGDPQIFTPQLIVNGSESVLGSDEGAVRTAIIRAKQAAPPVDISIAPDSRSGDLAVSFDARNHSPVPADANVWEIHFERYASTRVGAGENDGRTLENINNVTQFRYLGSWPQRSGHTFVISKNMPDDGVAVIVQAAHEGPILGAAVYYKPQAR